MDEPNIVSLTDQNGNAVPFEFLDLIHYENEEYVVLLPVEPDEGEEGQLVILRRIPTEDEEEDTYVGVEDEATAMAVYEQFKADFADEFDFAD